MPQGGSDERPYLDTLTLPGVLVMPGDPWPSDFYAHHPEAFRLPARLVWRDESPDRPGTPAPPPAGTAAPARSNPAGDAAVGQVSGEGAGAAVPGPDPTAGRAGGTGDPIGSFLRVNDALDRLQRLPNTSA